MESAEEDAFPLAAFLAEEDEAEFDWNYIDDNPIPDNDEETPVPAYLPSEEMISDSIEQMEKTILHMPHYMTRRMRRGTYKRGRIYVRDRKKEKKTQSERLHEWKNGFVVAKSKLRRIRTGVSWLQRVPLVNKWRDRLELLAQISEDLDTALDFAPIKGTKGQRHYGVMRAVFGRTMDVLEKRIVLLKAQLKLVSKCANVG